MPRHRIVGAFSAFLASVAVLTGMARSQGPGLSPALPRGFPEARMPEGTSLTAAKVSLGRHLFYDTRLSKNRHQSCATCHIQSMAFTDGRAQAVGSTGKTHPRSSMSLANVAYASALTWGDPTVRRLEDQVLAPVFGTAPVELGWTRPGTELVERLRGVPEYAVLFAAAFQGDPSPITIDNIAIGIAAFERTILSVRSPYDRYNYGHDDKALSASAKRGEVLFFSQPLSCFQCHGGFNFSGAVETAGGEAREPVFHNNGLYNVEGAQSYPAPNGGVFEITKDPKDIGKFKAPTLRNIAVTAPYMHDGSIETLEGVLDHYAAGGRTIHDGPFRGVGRDNPNKGIQIRGFTLSPGQRADLLAFLNSLTDEELLKDPRFSDPWSRPADAEKR